MMEYSSLLQTNEWKMKCLDVLHRDNYVCQDCRCIGIHNGTFFPISGISDLNKYLPDSLLNDEDLLSFCNNVEWTGKKISSPMFFGYKRMKENLFIYESTLKSHGRLFVN